MAGRFFGVLVDPHTYGSLFYMLLALATGIFYFTWAVTGASLSLGLAVLIIGIPFVILFIGATRILALVEGRIVEVMLGERMPRRPLYTDRSQPVLQRIGAMFTDPRTWGTLLYFVLMLPLGVTYFTVVVTLLTTGAALVAWPFAWWFSDPAYININLGGWLDPASPWVWPLSIAAGVLLVFATLHLCRLIGRGHAQLAKAMLVNGRPV